MLVGVALWVAMFKSGIDPVIAGLAVGLATSAYPPAREDLERATELTRSFREQPTPELARSAQLGVLSAISLNERLQYELHPWTSYVVVPLFALANAGIHVTGLAARRRDLLADHARASSSPTCVGKPLGILGASWLASRPALHGPRPPISWPLLVGGGAVAGIGFTVSLLISGLAFTGERLDEAKLGVLGCGDRRAAAGVGDLPRRQTPAQQRARAPDQRHGGGPDRPLRGRRSRARPHPRPRRRAGDARRVRRLRVPVLRPGRAGRARAARRRSTTTCATSGATCRSTTCTAARSSPPRRSRRPARREPSGRCTTRFLSHQDALAPAGHHAHRQGARPGRRAAVGGDPPPRARAARRRGRRQRRLPAACRARRRSSSTAAATRAPTTSTRSARPCAPRAGARA